MKTGLGLWKKYREFISYINYIRFTIRKLLIGFDSANIFLSQTDKYSVLLILKKYGAKIGRDCDIETGLTFHNCNDYKNLVIGNNCHIGKNCFFDLHDKIMMEDNVVVSMQCTFITHIDITKSELSKIYPCEQKQIIIKKNCYFGVRSTVLLGVEIGENSFVAAGSLVNKNVHAYTLIGGIPAKFIYEIKY